MKSIAMQKKLYLASQSVQRKRLMQEAGLEFEVLAQDADEKSCDWGMPLQKLTCRLAQLKMDHSFPPTSSQENERCWIVTADSLCIDKNGEILGKPRDYSDAIRMVKLIRQGTVAGTGFCIERRIWRDGLWHSEERYVGYNYGECVLDIPDEFIEWYFKKLKEISNLDYLKLSGGFSITGFGAQFLKSVGGSYTGILGLPLYDVRIGLKELGFFD